MKKEQKKKSLIRTILIDGILFFGLITLTFWIIFKDQDLGKVISIAYEANWIFLIIAILLMILYFIVEAWNITTLLNALGEKVSFKKIFRMTMVGFFFCSVTPGASGGQPLEIYYMSREGISAANATLAIMVQTCGIQSAVTGLGLICALFGNNFLSGPVSFLFAIGLIINLTALLILLACIFFTGGLRTVMRRFFGFLWQIGIKKADSWQKAVDKGLDKYAEGSRYIRTHKGEFKGALIKTAVQMSIFYLIPYMIYLSFGLTEYNVLNFFAMQSILFVSTSGLPLPGAIGASESVFLSLYGAAFGETMLGSAMLLTRGINFYLFVFVSMAFVFYTLFMVKKVRRKKVNS